MAEKTLNTRVLLKHDTLANWNSASSITLKKGEVAITTVETKQTNANGAIVTVPVTLMKVGDGNSKFSALPWTSALAADVYAWAKENALFVHKDGTGNVVSGIEWDATLNDGKGGVKYTTAAVATAEGLEDLQEAVAAIQKDITDNRDAWVLDTDTRYSFSTDGDKLVVKKTLYTNGVAGAEEAVGTYEFLTAGEVAETLKGYYTKTEVDTKLGDYALKSELHTPTTVAQGSGISVTGTDRNYTVAHADTSSVANVTKADRKYVSGVTFDDFGHVTAIETSEELDTLYRVDTTSGYAANSYQYQKSTDGGKTWTRASEMDINVGIIELTSQSPEITVEDDGDSAGKLQITFDGSGYKKVQTTVNDPTANGESLTFIDSITQNAQGVIIPTKKTVNLSDYTKTADIHLIKADAAITADKVAHKLTAGSKQFDGSADVEITAADLGLESAMHFVGALSEAPATAKSGDVYLNTATKKEYVYSEGQGWIELGDEGSHALKTIKIQAGTGLEVTAGGTLAADTTLGIADGGVDTDQLADKGVTEEKLEQDVQDALALARTSIQGVEFVQGSDGATLNVYNENGKDDYMSILGDDYIETEVREGGQSLHIEASAALETAVSNANTAHGWGDHSKEGYLKSGDIAGKADKVAGATAGNFAGLDANGNLTDSGKKAGDFATKEQGDKADTAVQSASFAGTAFTKSGTALSISQTDARTALGLGTAAYKAEGDFATADEYHSLNISVGAPFEAGKKDTHFIQLTGYDRKNPQNGINATLGEAYFEGAAGIELSIGTGSTISGQAIKIAVEEEIIAGAAKGATSIQSVAAAPNGGLKVTSQSDDGKDIDIEIDDTITWIFDCGGAGV